MKLDRIDIKLSNTKNVFFRTGNDVTCKYYFTLKVPQEFAYFVGTAEGVIEGVAKCHDDDKFSMTKGRKIALAKAEARAYRLVYNEIERGWNEVEQFLKDYAPMKEEFHKKGLGVGRHNEEYVERISNDETIND